MVLARTTPRSHAARNRVEHSLESVEGYVRDFAEDNPHVRFACCASPTCSAPTSSRRISRALELPVGAVASSASTPASSSCTRTTCPVDPLRARPTTCPASSTSPATACCRGARWPQSVRQAHHPACRPSAPGWRTWPLNRIGVPTCRRELLDLLRYGRGVDNRRLKEAGFRYEYTSAGAVKAFIEADAPAPDDRLDHEPHLPLRARRRAVLPALTGRGPTTAADAMAAGSAAPRWSTASPS